VSFDNALPRRFALARTDPLDRVMPGDPLSGKAVENASMNEMSFDPAA
jgi:hypothetical protein